MPPFLPPPKARVSTIQLLDNLDYGKIAVIYCAAL